MPNLSRLLNPSSVAVVGASRDPNKLGSIVVRNIVESGFRGTVYPINPKAETVFNLKCYSSLALLPEIPDLVIISLPAELVLDSLIEVVKRGTKDVVIFSAGFKETDSKGVQLENKLLQYALENDLNILGPNCLGFANTTTPINATFGKVAKLPGDLRFISQSGAVAAGIFDWAEHTGLGFSEFVTLGNKTVLGETEILKHWATEDLADFAPIGMYLESITNGKEFLKVATKLSQKHPIFILKPGKSKAAQKAMQSHTGAIAGEDYVLETAFKQAGIIRCHDIQDMFDMSLAFSWLQVPKGPNMAVVSNAGGPAVISADLISEFGLNLAQLSPETTKILSEHLPRSASLANPVDVLGDALADRYRYALKAVLAEDAVDSVLVILTPQIMTQIKETAQVISELSKDYQKPIVCTFIGGTQVFVGEAVLNFNQVPSYRFPERAIKAIANMYKWQSWVLRNKDLRSATETMPLGNPILSSAEEILSQAKATGKKSLDIMAANKILSLVDIKLPEALQVTSFDEAMHFAQKVGYPVVLKISSSEVLHKKDVGGVITNIKSYKDLVTAFKTISSQSSKLGGDIVIQKQIEDGIEVIVGVKKDPSFGNVLMFGAGGTLAELIEDRNLYLLPVDLPDVQRLVENSKISKLLNGYRGDTKYALGKLYDLIINISLLAESLESVEAIEINPVIVTKSEVWAVDGKVII